MSEQTVTRPLSHPTAHLSAARLSGSVAPFIKQHSKGMFWNKKNWAWWNQWPNPFLSNSRNEKLWVYWQHENSSLIRDHKNDHPMIHSMRKRHTILSAAHCMCGILYMDDLQHLPKTLQHTMNPRMHSTSINWHHCLNRRRAVWVFQRKIYLHLRLTI